MVLFIVMMVDIGMLVFDYPLNPLHMVDHNSRETNLVVQILMELSSMVIDLDMSCCVVQSQFRQLW